MFRQYYQATVPLMMAMLLLGSTHASAIPLESVDHLNALAKAFVENTISVSPDDKLEVNTSQTSKNFTVAQCGVPITVNFPPNASQESASTVEMTCAGPQLWHIYVPIDIRIMTKVVVAKQPITAKETITEDMLDYAEYDKNRVFSGYYKNFSQIVGQEAVSMMAAGAIITKHSLQKPIVIHRNQNVAIVAKKGFIMVKADGIAKSDGGLDDMIKVFNPASKRTIDGIVVDSSTVDVSG